MRLFQRTEDFPREAISITIGNFDGVHKGHVHILKHLKQLAAHQQTGLITFSNHPAHILRPIQAPSLLCTQDHKIKLLNEQGIDNLFIIPFTPHLAEQCPETFICNLRNVIPFSHLVLGHDARLGKDRQGTPSAMHHLAQKWAFEVHYLDACQQGSRPISSTSIREAIQIGDLTTAAALLERPYSIYSKVAVGLGKGQQMGFPTANIDVQGLCVPPYGVYVVTVHFQGQNYRGIANLGVAPTIKNSIQPTLEVHLFDVIANLYDQHIEVRFHRFLRPEKKFASIAELKTQVQADIEEARKFVQRVS